MENNSTANNNKERVPFKLSLNGNIPFNSVGDIVITTTTELSKQINSVFKSTFKDYYGSILQCQFMPDRGAYVIVPRLYFTILPNGAYSESDTDGSQDQVAFKPLGKGNNSDIVGRVMRLSNVNTSGSAKVAMTTYAKDILSDFIIKNTYNQFGGKEREFNWNEAYSTSVTENGTFIGVFKLDINKFINTLYGERDDNGGKLYYQITPVNVVGGMMNQYRKPDNWVLNILRLNEDNQAKAADLLGIPYIVGNGPSAITDIGDVVIR